MLEVRNLSKNYATSGATAQVRAIDGIGFAVEKGRIFTLLGPSGCGKTTTLRCIAGLETPDAGEIVADGQTVFSAGDGVRVPANARGFGMVFQSYAIWPHMTVFENVAFPLQVPGRTPKYSRREIDAEVSAMLAIVDLAGYEDRPATQLSGGQQQRLALARALIAKPSLLLLDEPLSNLDASLRLTMRTEIRRIQRELGVTTILVTHDQIEATTMADRIVVMNGGRVEQEGTAKELYERPATLFVATFIGSPPINLFDGVSGDAGVRIREAALPLSSPAAGDVVVGIRPESVRANGRGMQARIAAVEPMGREVLYTAESALGAIRFVEAGADARLREGDDVALDYAPRDVLLFDKASGRRLETRIAS